jgi:acyl-CoA reductase-like NAD-dependent aldehyde dehydrogenase
MQEYKMWIGGEWVDAMSRKTFVTLNPATEEELSRVPLCGKEDVDRAVAAARKAFPAWSRMPQSERSKQINKIAAVLRENADDLATIEILEHGTPVSDAKRMILYAAEILDYTASASRTIMGEFVPAVPDVVTYLQRVPVGVCALIIPWNVPLLLMAVKLGPAIATGNTCVIKPPSINSGIGLRFAQVLSKADLPPGVINVITGPGGSVGHALATHPDVDLIGMTGSSETGKTIMSAASQTVKRLVMELGGNNPVLVLKDADIDAVVKLLSFRQFNNAGMHCSGPGRYYLHESIYDEFVEKFVAAAKKVVVGDPRDPKTVMGPVVSAEHRDKLEHYFKMGRDQGAEAVLGGSRPVNPPLNKGYFVMPTVFTNVTHDMIIAKEEKFGPVACFLKFSSEEEVLRLANDSQYGLCAAVWTRDMRKGMRFVRELHAGTVFVNTHMLTPELPWGGGIKESGIGKEGSIVGMQEFTEVKMVCLNMVD